MGLKLITPPATDPITLAEAKAHLRVAYTDEDTMISALVKAATRNCELWTGRAFVDQTWDLYLDSFPGSMPVPMNTTNLEIKIPLPPLIEITQIAYDDPAGDEQIVASGNYYVDNVTEPGWVVPQGSLIWPSTIDAINSVRVRFRAGYMDTNSPASPLVPEDIKSAIKLTLGALYEYRETISVATNIKNLPWGAEQLLRQHRVLLGMA